MRAILGGFLRGIQFGGLLVVFGSVSPIGVAGAAGDDPGDWTQWGGPARNFTASSGQLAEEWPEEGPPRIWKRPLGDGYSAILAVGDTLFTLFRRGEEDVVVAVDAETGKDRWTTSYSAPVPESMIQDGYGIGPHSTPLVVEDRLFTVSSTIKLHALSRETGKILWARDLVKEMGVMLGRRGYGSSPIAYEDTVILALGGQDKGIAAFDQATGEEVWKSQSTMPSYASPVLGNLGGKEYLFVAQGANGSGLDPGDGSLAWSVDLTPNQGAIMTTPHWGSDGLIFCSSAYAGGSGTVRIFEAEGAVQTERLWFSRKMRVQHGTLVRIGDYVYGSSGDFGPCFLMAIHVATGEVAWRNRDFAKATCLLAGEKLLILDEDGVLALATARPEGLTVHSKANPLEHQAWTVPTLQGTRLYLRDRKHLLALELGKE